MDKAIELLKKDNQEKVLKEIEKNKNPELIEQILNIDFNKVSECKNKILKENQFNDYKIEKISFIDGNKLSKEEKENYEKIGRNIISNGKYAVVTMAGGQRNKTWSFRTKRYIFYKCRARAKVFI